MAEVCAECGASFASAAALMQHVRHGHGRNEMTVLAESGAAAGTAPILCGRCGERFSSPEALARHCAMPHARRSRVDWSAPAAP